MQTLLGKTFEIECRNIGDQIENILGGKINKRSGADFGFWECKSKKSDAKSPMTLGGRASVSKIEILASVYDKVDNTILVWYTINENKTFTIDKITILFDMDIDRFFDVENNFMYFESRKKQTTIRISKKHFLELYGKNKIEYW